MDGSIRNHYRNSKHRLLLLDYDGTLVDFTERPEDSSPSLQLIGILKALGDNPANTVVIVSGRDHQTLEAWLGKLPVDMIAEHGHTIRTHGGQWKIPVQVKAKNWKHAAMPIMKHVAATLPGSFIEEKDSTLVWHFKRNGSAKSQKIERDLNIALAPIIAKYNLKIMNDFDNVEVMPSEINKGDAANFWLQSRSWDFILAAGDDTTDEDLFAAMPEVAFTVKVRPGASQANYRLAGSVDLLTLLSSLLSTHV